MNKPKKQIRHQLFTSRGLRVRDPSPAHFPDTVGVPNYYKIESGLWDQLAKDLQYGLDERLRGYLAGKLNAHQ